MRPMNRLHLGIGIVALLYSWSLPAQEVASKGTGLRFESRALYEVLPLASMPLMGDLPPSQDLSGMFPVVGDQGTQPSCVGWALAYLKAYQEQTDEPHDPMRRFSPSFVYNQSRIGSSCGSGATFVRGLEVLRKRGVPLMERFPYDPASCSAEPSGAVLSGARIFAIQSYRRLDPTDEVSIKGYLASDQPVLVGMVIDDAFRRLAPGQVYTVPAAPLNRSGHAMVVTGYDDQRGAYKVINSWGTGWADQGFGWIAYPAFHATVKEAYIVQDRGNVLGATAGTPSLELGPAVVSREKNSLGEEELVVRLAGSTLRGAIASELRINVFFTDEDGVAIPAQDNPTRRLVSAVQVDSVDRDSVDLGRYPIAVPKRLLDSARPGITKVVVTVFVDGFPVAETAPADVAPDRNSSP